MSGPPCLIYDFWPGNPARRVCLYSLLHDTLRPCTFPGLECPFPQTSGTSTLAYLLSFRNHFGARVGSIVLHFGSFLEGLQLLDLHDRSDALHNHADCDAPYLHACIRISYRGKLSAFVLFGPRCVSSRVLVKLLASLLVTVDGIVP